MSPRDALEGLYQARDELDEALNKIKTIDPTELANGLSSYYRVSITLLQNACALVDELGTQAEQAHSHNPHVQVALAEIGALRTELAECSSHAEHGQATANLLHQDEAPQVPWTTGKTWTVTNRRR